MFGYAKISIAVCLLCPAGLESVCGQTTAPSEARSRMAQLRVLEIRRCESNGDQLAAREITRYVRQGFPAELFTDAALREAAQRDTVDRLLRLPPAGRGRVFARAKVCYGLDVVKVFERLPPIRGDVVSLFRDAVAKNIDPHIAIEPIISEPIPPQMVEVLIAESEKIGSDIARRLLKDILRHDASDVGHRWLADLAKAAKSGNEQAEYLDIFRQRHEFDQDVFQYLADRASDDIVLGEVFETAEGLGMGGANRPAIQFLIDQLGSPRGAQRVAAARALTRTLHREAAPAILRSVATTQDDAVRVALVRTLEPLSGEPAVEEHLFEIVASDPSEDVRVVAIECLRTDVSSPSGGRQRLDRLRAVLGPNPPSRLKQVLDAKTDDYERNFREQSARQSAKRSEAILEELSYYARRQNEGQQLSRNEVENLRRVLAATRRSLDSGEFDAKSAEGIRVRSIIRQIEGRLAAAPAQSLSRPAESQKAPDAAQSSQPAD